MWFSLQIKMSLGQLTANYTDSEGEDNDRLSDDTSHKSTPVGGTRVTELRDEGSRRGTPFSGESVGSGTPQKKVTNLLLFFTYFLFFFSFTNTYRRKIIVSLVICYGNTHEFIYSIYFAAFSSKLPQKNGLGKHLYSY